MIEKQCYPVAFLVSLCLIQSGMTASLSDPFPKNKTKRIKFLKDKKGVRSFILAIIYSMFGMVLYFRYFFVMLLKSSDSTAFNSMPADFSRKDGRDIFSSMEKPPRT